MLRSLHNLLVRNSLTRRYQFRLLRRMRHIVGCPDAYGDLIAIAISARLVGILDIGSFIGDTIVMFLDELNMPVYGFEPTPKSFELLRKRFRGNDLVHLFNVALADSEGTRKFFCNKLPRLNSLLDNDLGNEISFGDGAEHVETAEVHVTTLDRWVSEYLPEGQIIVKADVQGTEGLLLDGGVKTFSQRVAAFYSEGQLHPMYKGQTDFNELHSRMTTEFGFCLHNVYPCFHDKHGRAVHLDALWVREEYLQCLAPGIS